MATTEPPFLTEMYCSQCGRALTPPEAIHLGGVVVCAACQPVYLRRLQEGAAAAAIRYKGFWIRLVAKMIDGLVLLVMMTPLFFLLISGYMRPLAAAARAGRQPDPALALQFTMVMALLELMGILVGWFYNTVMLAQFQATLGKMAIAAKVVRPDGSRISWGQAAGRSGMELVSGLLLYIGYIVAAFDREKRTLHDLVAETRVIVR